MKFVLRVLVLWLFLMVPFLQAQEESGMLVMGESVLLSSKILKEDRVLLVYTPDNYDAMVEKKYPVLYLLDGENHFLHVAGIVQFLSSNWIVPQMIVVGILNTDRNRDMTSMRISDLPSSGGALQFLEFLEKECFPLIESRFRTEPYRILAGHSLGGLFSTYVWLTRPDLFGGYLAMSPALGLPENMLLENIDVYLKALRRNNKVLYLTLGNEPSYLPALQKLTGMLEANPQEGFRWRQISLPKSSHSMTPHLSVYHGLEFIFEGWQLPTQIYVQGWKAIESHYQTLSQQFGFEIKVPEQVVRRLGYETIQSNQEEAKIIFQEYVRLYPHSPKSYDSLGELYELMGDFRLAKEQYEIAVKKSRYRSDGFESMYQEHLQRVAEKLINSLF